MTPEQFEQAKREFAEKYKIGEYVHRPLVFKDVDRDFIPNPVFLSDLTALISEHYYTREFLLWFHDNVQIESREETFLVYNDIRFYTLNEVRDFWQRVQEKKEYVKRKKNEL